MAKKFLDTPYTIVAGFRCDENGNVYEILSGKYNNTYCFNINRGQGRPGIIFVPSSISVSQGTWTGSVTNIQSTNFDRNDSSTFITDVRDTSNSLRIYFDMSSIPANARINSIKARVNVQANNQIGSDYIYSRFLDSNANETMIFDTSANAITITTVDTETSQFEVSVGEVSLSREALDNCFIELYHYRATSTSCQLALAYAQIEVDYTVVE